MVTAATHTRQSFRNITRSQSDVFKFNGYKILIRVTSECWRPVTPLPVKEEKPCVVGTELLSAVRSS